MASEELLKQINKGFDEIVAKKKNTKELAETFAPFFERMANENAEINREIIEIAKNLKENLNIVVPEIKAPKVNVTVPEVKIPKIEAPQVNVEVPKVEVPNIIIPDKMNVDGIVGLNTDLENPIPVQLRDANGKPVKLGGGTAVSGGGGSGNINKLYEFFKAARDGTTNALKTITYEHHEIHGGSHYECVNVVDLAINNVRDLQITTPNTTKWAHMTLTISCESETDVYFYEGVTINTPGTGAGCFNSDRNSANTAGLTINYIDNTSVANANADTAVAGASGIAHVIIGAGKDAGSEQRGKEIILKQDTDYCIRFIASAAGYVNYNLQWYEHTNKIPL